MKIELKIDGASREQLVRYTEILTALLSSGGLDGVKNGQTILHFDRDAEFMGVELKYWPWRKRVDK